MKMKLSSMEKRLKCTTTLLILSVLVTSLISKLACIPLALSVYRLVKLLSEKQDVSSDKMSSAEVWIIALLVLSVSLTMIMLFTASPFKGFLL